MGTLVKAHLTCVSGCTLTVVSVHDCQRADSDVTVVHTSQMADNMNCYDVLRLTPGATQAEVRQAYLKLAKECHPDKTGDTDTTHIFQHLCQAYWTLHDPIGLNMIAIMTFSLTQCHMVKLSLDAA